MNTQHANNDQIIPPRMSVLGQIVTHIFDTIAVGEACTFEDLALGGFSNHEIDVCATEAASVARRRFVKQLAEVN